MKTDREEAPASPIPAIPKDSSAPPIGPRHITGPVDPIASDGLIRSGKFAGGIRNDIARRLPWYTSDWTDGVAGGIKTFTATLYMFFGCLAPAIAFGSFLDEHTKSETGVVEYLVTQGFSGVFFALFSGQPLIILRPTGPITVFLSQLYNICDSMDVPFLTVQAWTGIFVGMFMIIISVTDLCALIRYCSRFTQDLFGFFVSAIFITLGLTNIIDKFTTKTEAQDNPDVKVHFEATHELILTVVTLSFAWYLANFNKSPYFNAWVRDTVSSFAVPIAIITFAVVANLMSVDLDPLPVPEEFEPTKPGRDWMVDLCPADACGKSILVGAVAALPLVLLFFIDQNVTSLLTQSPDHKLRKGAAFHLNFFILGMFNIVFPSFGCPFVTGSIPHSPQFVRALAKTEVIREGGRETTSIVSVYENRVAPLGVNALIVACLPIVWELRKVPTAVINDALFLFMGLSGLPGNQLWERFKMLFMEEKLMPPMPFSRKEVPLSRMHAFTLIQFGCMCFLYAVARSPISIAFPVFLVATIPVRMLIPRLTGGYVSQEVVEILDGTRQPKLNAEIGKEDKETAEQTSATTDSTNTSPPNTTA
mmetsp:Transcript_59737/g.142133  ORF Transcript_59737/g.142133 Transcript_59737/m.142133 type:complete len:591 (-) Transcript_59737:151-1923(-)|eukprot:CAMPEP_0178389436 /NCGR_PEP_ID=MMETSP0689_2-20121128/10115_1 /TAXON_ID=160604 /ORGANISM="Amphidinium massartii, Strain CS-259" /LENGTH=590 /DNA_ID=CAMNT_0020009885 /DNA_START=36 /DNA_END=1808 /DNA_ORIENTATION=+